METAVVKKTPAAVHPVPTPPAPTPPEILRPAGAAQFLGVSRGKLAQWRREGIGPAWSRLGARVIAYRLEDLRAFVASGLRKGA